MSWKIKSILIENFKYFHDAFQLNVNSRNLLIYGENGSGKSSIYWALYTLFQSRLKTTVADVEKYFDATKGENLRNKYSANGDVSKVEVIFEDSANPAAGTQAYTISLGNVTTQRVPDTFLDFTVAASDFLNYKMLYKLTDKDNSVINDITDIFIKEIYPFADFQTDYIDLNGNSTGIRNAKLWHEYIYSSTSQLEHQHGKRQAHYDKTDIKYGRYKRLIRDFRDQLAIYLADLSLRATTKLRDKFGIKDVEIRFETDASYDFDLQLPESPRYRDHELHPLHIRLNAKLKNARLPGGEADIIHLRTFFNEAKLTCIGLAIRLAVVDMKFVAGSNLASVLCMDDLLVSLDMSYRVPVTKILLEYARNYQLCVFTHDRSLYNLMSGVIKELGFPKNEWLKLEFYRSDPAIEALEEPRVHYIEPKEGIEQVKNYIAQGDYPAAGNSLRKYAEELIKGILPLNLTYDITNDGEITRLMLRALYDKTKSRGEESFCELYDISPAVLPDISKHLNRLMNPLSHDNKDIPIFRQELEDAIIEVQKYEPIRDAKRVIVSRQDALRKQYKMEMTNGGASISMIFVTTEQWDYFDFPAPMGRKYKNCEVQIKSVDGCFFTIGAKLRVKRLYKVLMTRAGLSEAAAPVFDQSISEVATGSLLSAL